MSGGNSAPDPYYQRDPPKSYRDAVKPKRVEIDQNGKKWFFYECEHCGKEFKVDERKTGKRAFHDRKCRGAWDKERKRGSNPKIEPAENLKSYRGAVKPKRIEVDQDGKRWFFYECEHCGKEFKDDKRKKHKRAFCDKKCQHAWDKGRKRDYSSSGFSRHHSEEERRKQSERMKKRWADPEFRKKMVERIREVTQSEEYRKKMSEVGKEVASRPEWKKKQSRAHKGKKRPPEVGKKISKAKMGHEVSEETRKKLADAAKGEKSSFWKGGISGKRERFYRSWQWRRQATRVKSRDNNTCQGCGWTENEAKELGVHHIDPLETTEYNPYDYPDELLATLCKVCHAKTEQQGGELLWPVNGRGDESKLDRLENPESRQTKLDEFEKSSANESK